MTQRRMIENLLRTALLKDGGMAYALFEYELKEHINYWYQGLKRDKDEFVFVVTENSGDVAMLLITADKSLYINEEARYKLRELWPLGYNSNLQRLIPNMAAELANDIISVNGVKTWDPDLKNTN